MDGGTKKCGKKHVEEGWGQMDVRHKMMSSATHLQMCHIPKSSEGIFCYSFYLVSFNKSVNMK